MTTCIALIRGINVGKAKRVAMADLRALITDRGHRNVRTLLNSGNAIFDMQPDTAVDTASISHDIKDGILTRCGVSAQVIVIEAGTLERIVAGDPFKGVATDPSRYLVAFTSGASTLTSLEPLNQEEWDLDRFALGGEAAYLWCAAGILESPLAKRFARLSGEAFTTRNWSTVLKLRELASAS